jgi:hypothetical protein
VFLLAGPATNLASLAALTGTLGVAATARYVVSISAGALVMGVFADWTYQALGLSAQAVAGSSAEVFPPVVGSAAALFLVATAVEPHLPFRRKRPQPCSGST